MAHEGHGGNYTGNFSTVPATEPPFPDEPVLVLAVTIVLLSGNYLIYSRK